MANINHRIGIKSSLQKVYEALSTIEGISNWWTIDTTGVFEIGKTIIVRFHSLEGKKLGSMNMKINALEPNKKVQWKFTSGPNEWLNMK